MEEVGWKYKFKEKEKKPIKISTVKGELVIKF